MPAAPPPHPEALAEAPLRKRFTRDEVERMSEAGFFNGQRCELIDGDLIDKMGQKPPHAFAIQVLLDWLAGFMGTGRVRVQLPMEAAEGQEWTLPEPDLAVLHERKADYQHRHPRGNELLQVIEVADTSAAFDLSRKAEIYAQAGVPEYWVLNLVRRKLVVHRRPEDGKYRDLHTLSETEIASMEGRAERVTVESILPARS